MTKRGRTRKDILAGRKADDERRAAMKAARHAKPLSLLGPISPLTVLYNPFRPQRWPREGK